MKQNNETDISKSLNENVVVRRTGNQEIVKNTDPNINIINCNDISAIENMSSNVSENSVVTTYFPGDDSAFPICKICFLFKNPIDGACDLIAPCGCKGSIKYVHKTCLRLWRFKGKNIREIKKCEQCCCDYKVPEDLMPYLMIVRSTTAVSIVLAIFVAKCVINTGGEALAFLVDEDNLAEDIIYNNGIAGYKYFEERYKQAENKKGGNKNAGHNKAYDAKTERNKTDHKKTHQRKKTERNKMTNKTYQSTYTKKDTKFEDVVAKMKKRSIDMQNIGYKYYEDSVSRFKRYLDNRVYKEKFALTFYSTITLFLVTYAFMFCWSFWPVANFLFTIWRIYQFKFWIDKVILFGFNCYYMVRLYQDLFVHVDSWYIFLLNYNYE